MCLCLRFWSYQTQKIWQIQGRKTFWNRLFDKNDLKQSSSQENVLASNIFNEYGGELSASVDNLSQLSRCQNEAEIFAIIWAKMRTYDRSQFPIKNEAQISP